MVWELLKEVWFIVATPKNSRLIKAYGNRQRGFGTLNLRLTIFVLALTLLVSIPHSVTVISKAESNPDTRGFMSWALAIMVELVPSVLTLAAFHMTKLDIKHRRALFGASVPYVVLVLVIQLSYYDSNNYSVPKEMFAAILPYSVVALSYALAVILPHVRREASEQQKLVEQLAAARLAAQNAQVENAKFNQQLAQERSYSDDLVNRLEVVRQLHLDNEQERTERQGYIKLLEQECDELKEKLSSAQEQAQAAHSAQVQPLRDRELLLEQPVQVSIPNPAQAQSVQHGAVVAFHPRTSASAQVQPTHNVGAQVQELIEATPENIASLRAQGKSWGEIEQLTGVKTSTLRSRLDRNGAGAKANV
jgi:hypothetical protein